MLIAALVSLFHILLHPSFNIKSGDTFTDAARRKRKLFQTVKNEENALNKCNDYNLYIRYGGGGGGGEEEGGRDALMLQVKLMAS